MTDDSSGGRYGRPIESRRRSLIYTPGAMEEMEAALARIAEREKDVLHNGQIRTLRGESVWNCGRTACEACTAAYSAAMREATSHLEVPDDA